MGQQKAPSFPFYYRDWLHAVRRWNSDNKIEYLEMLCEQADQPNGSIPEDIFNTECNTEKVRGKFELDANGYFNVRLRDVLLKRDRFKKSRLENLKGSSDKPQVENHMEPHMEKEIEKEKVNKKPAKVKEPPPPLVFPFTDEVFLNRWGAWKKYKEEQFKFKYKHSGEQAALKNLGELSRGNLEVALSIIQQSMANGWKGFFQLKTGNQPTTPAEAADYAERVKNAMK